jgi:hypothetical protein
VTPEPGWRAIPVRQFVPVDSSPALAPDVELSVPIVAVEPADGWDARVSLFGELER